MMKLALYALLCASTVFPAQALAQCSGMESAGIGTQSTTSTYENAGVYEWNESLQAWVLIEATYIPYFESETLREFDEYIPPGTFWGSGGGGGSGGDIVLPNGAESGRGKRIKDSGNVAASSCSEPHDMPPVVVTGRRPSSYGSILSIFWRGNLLDRAVGAARRPVLRSVDADQTVTCNSSYQDREGAASDAIRPLGLLPAGSVIRVNYGSGHYQLWLVTQPYLTTRGLLESSRCFS